MSSSRQPEVREDLLVERHEFREFLGRIRTLSIAPSPTARTSPPKRRYPEPLPKARSVVRPPPKLQRARRQRRALRRIAWVGPTLAMLSRCRILQPQRVSCRCSLGLPFRKPGRNRPAGSPCRIAAHMALVTKDVRLYEDSVDTHTLVGPSKGSDGRLTECSQQGPTRDFAQAWR